MSGTWRLRPEAWRLVVVSLAVLIGGCSALPPRDPGHDGADDPPTRPATTDQPPAGERPATTPEPTIYVDDDIAPDSFALINAASADGQIDDEQALVFKLYAIFADERLPARYRGDDEELHADSVIMEAVERVDELRPENRAIVSSFIAWPGEPESWLGRRLLARTATAGLAGTAKLEDFFRHQYETVEDSPHVRIFYRLDRPQDEETARFLASVTDSQIWPKLTNLMGDPLPKPPGTKYGLGPDLDPFEVDDRVEVFLTGEPIRSFARAHHSCKRHPTSGFIVLGSGDANSIVLTHELMHVIQFRFPLQTRCHHPEYMWLHEASAQWSIDYVYPDSQAERGRRIPKCFIDHPGLPLSLRNDCREYGAYLFFQYLDRSYAPGYIREVWEHSARHDSLTAIDAAVASLGGLHSIWPEFAVTAYNVEPVRHFHNWDAFEPGAAHQHDRPVLGGERTRRYSIRGDVEHMAALYHRFTFADDSIGRVLFKHPFADGEQPTAAVQALVKWEGEGWSIEDWTADEEKRFCFSPGQRRLEELVIIISNSEHRDRAAQLRANPQPYLEVALGCAGEGTITVSRTKSGTYTSRRDFPVNVSFTDSATISFQLEADEHSADSFATVEGTVTWSYSLSATETGDGCSVVEEAEGGGTYRIGEGAGPFLMFGWDENGASDPDAYLVSSGAAPVEYVDRDPQTHYQVASTICAEEVPLEEHGLSWVPYFPSGSIVWGTVGSDAKVLSGTRQRTYPPLSDDGLPTIETITWQVTLP